MSVVAIVTDSTAYLRQSVRDAVHVVPLRVHLGSETYTEGVDVTPADVVRTLKAKVPVSTSRPSPAEFAAVYRSCLEAGADHVVSVHLAAALSGTWESAVLASQDFGYGVVRVVDSRGTAAALGFAVEAAAAAAATGESVAAVQQAATAIVDSTKTLFYVDTLEYLRRGGRIGTATALLATSLSVKPLLHMVEGQIVALEKVRTPTRALARIVSLTADAAGSGPVDVAVQHLAAPARAEAVAGQLQIALPTIRELQVAELGPVLGAHLGPGVIGVVLVRR
ncbi:MAG TPA: DegV family protein [Jatrophihabitans sp.]|jgi:DegV family protein with EDD domain